MNINYKNRILYVAVLCACFMANNSQALAYNSLSEAIRDTTSPRNYSLNANETSSTTLGSMGGTTSTLTIDGSTGNYGINNTSTATNARLFVEKATQTLNLQNLGSYTVTTSNSIIEGINIITGVEVGNSVNNFGVTNDYVGFLRSAGKSNVSNSVFYNNYGQYGAALQNRENGVLSVTGSVFVNNTSQQGTIHNDSTNKIEKISDSIFYNNTASNSTSSTNVGVASAIFNKSGTTIDLISNSSFINNSTTTTQDKQYTGTIYNTGTIGQITGSVFYNNTSQNGAVINNISSGTITNISDSKFAYNTSSKFGATITNFNGSTIGTISGSLFTNNTGITGIIGNQGSITKIIDSDFKNNKTTNNGIISIYSTTADTTASLGEINNVQVINNTGNGLFARTSLNTSTVNIGKITQSKFNNNSQYGFIISDNVGEATVDEISNSEFNNNGERGIYLKNNTASGKDTGNILIKKISDIKVNNNSNGGISFLKSANNTLQVNEISGIEVKNNTKSSGNGAGINNSGATIGKISNAVFENNVINSTTRTNGGAIYNTGTINEIDDVTISECGAYNGGAIFNTGTIGSITNLSASNIITNDDIIASESNATIGIIDNITIDNSSGTGLSFYGASGTTIKNSIFTNMYGHMSKMGYGLQVTASPNSSSGSANVDTIDNITVLGNQTGGLRIDDNKSSTNTAHVGLIKNSQFISNGTNNNDKAGGIWAKTDTLTISADGDGKTTTFKGNKRNNESTGIWMENKNSTLNLQQLNSGEMFMYDRISGTSQRYYVNISGDNSGTLHLYDDIANGMVDIKTTNIDTIDGKLHNYNFSTLSSDADSQYTLDIFFDTSDTDPHSESDTFSISNASLTPQSGITRETTGKITLKALNFLNDDVNETMIGKSATVQIIKIKNKDTDNLQLVNGFEQAPGGFVLFTLQDDVKTEYDEIVEHTNWNDLIKIYNVKKRVLGDVDIIKTDTVNDTLKITIVESTKDKTFTGNYLDTLAAVNQATLETRYFETFDTDAVYNVTSNLGGTAAGDFVVIGKDSENLSLIDFNETEHYKGFELDNTTNLTLKNVEIKNSSILTTGIATDSNINIHNSYLHDNGAGLYTAGNINIEGKTRIDDDIRLMGDNSALTVTGKINDETTATDITFNGNIVGSETSTLTFGAGSVTLGNNAAISNTDLVLNDVTLNVGANEAFSNVNLNSGNSILNLQNDSIGGQTFNTMKLSSDIQFNIDMNLDTPKSDTITASYAGGSGRLVLSNINLLGAKSWGDFTSSDKGLKIKILNSDSDSLQLGLSSDLETIFDDAEVLLGTIETSRENETILQTTDWNKNYSTTIYQNNEYGKWKLAKTDTTNDSLAFESYTIAGETKYETMGDTLKLVNQAENNTIKDFTTNTDGAIYEVTDNLGATKGTVNINGVQGNDNETIDLKGFTGFELGNGATAVNFNNVTITDSTLTPTTTTIATITNENAAIGMNNAAINGNISANVGYNLTIGGTTTINGTVGNSNATFNGTELKFNTDTFTNASLNTIAGTVDVKDNSFSNYSISKLTSDENVNYDIDFGWDGNNLKSDKFTVGTGSSGKITIDPSNFDSFLTNISDDESITVQIIKASGSIGPQLAYTNAKTRNDVNFVTANMTSDIVIGNDYFLNNTDTTNDSITFRGITDTFRAWAKLNTTDDKTFTFVNDVDYTLAKDTDLFGKKITINGNENTINLNNKTLLTTVDSTQNITFKNTTLTNAKNITNNGKLSFEDASIDSKITNSSGSELTIKANNNKTITFAKDIDGSDYTLNLTGGNSGVIKLNNQITANNAILDTVTIELGNENTLANTTLNANSGIIAIVDNEFKNYNIGKLTSNANTRYNMDLIFDNGQLKSDTFTVGTGSSGKIYISSININNDMPDETSYTLQIIKTTDTTAPQLDYNGSKILVDATATMQSDIIIAKDFGLATTNTTNDSIRIRGAKNTFKAWADLDTDEHKEFTFLEGVSIIQNNVTLDGNSNAEVINNGSVTNKGVLENFTLTNNNSFTNEATVSGVINNDGEFTNKDTGTVSGTITNNSGAEFTSNAENLTPTDSKITNNGKLIFTGGNNNNEIIKTSGTNSITEFKGTSENNAAITQDKIEIASSGNVTNNAMMTGAILNEGTLSSSASKLNGTITNDKTLNLTGGINNNIIQNGETFSGVVNLNGVTQNNQNITAKEINNSGISFINTSGATLKGDIKNTGRMTANANDLNDTNNSILNDGVLTLKGGTNTNEITTTAAASVVNLDDVTANSADINAYSVTNTGTDVISNSANINAISYTNYGKWTNTTDGKITADNIINNGVLTSSTEKLIGAVNNLGTLNLTGTLKNTISGNGKTVVDSTLTLDSNANIDGKLDLNNGTLKLSSTSNTTTNHTVGAIEGTGDLYLDIKYSDTGIESDTITLTADTTTAATVKIKSLTEIGTRPTDFTKQILIGANANTILNIDAIKSQFDVIGDFINKEQAVNLDTNEINWSDNYGSKKWTEVYDRILSVTGSAEGLSDSIKYTSTMTSKSEEIYDPKAENLAIMNQYDKDGSENRSVNFAGILADDTAKGEYKVKSDLGMTESGKMTLNGETDGEKRATIDFDNHKGFEIRNSNTELVLKDLEIKNSSSLVSGNAENGVKITLDNVNIHDNGTGIQTAGDIEIKGNSTISDDITVTGANSKIDINGSDEINLDSNLTGTDNSKLNIKNGTVNLEKNANISGFDTTLQNTNLNLARESSLQGLNTTFNGSNNINLANNHIGTLSLDNVNLNGTLKMQVDADLAKAQMDKLSANSAIIGPNGKIEVSKINLLSPTTQKRLDLLFTNNSNLANAVKYTGEGQIAYSPIYKYNTSYIQKSDGSGYFSFVTPGKDYNDFNPAVMASSVTAIVSGYQNQMQALHNGFYHMNRYMKHPHTYRFAAENQNKYALLEPATNIDINEVPETSQAMWTLPYSSFERVSLRGGIKVDNISYGMTYGGDSNMFDMAHGFKGLISAFVGYNGNQMSYNGISMSQNGGFLGATLNAYKGNFFTGLTLSTGASTGDAHTMYGKEDITLLTAGIANKTGYNFEINKGKIIIQPSLFLGYSWVNTFDYTNASGAKINQDALNALQIAPGLKIIGNTKNGWQPYAGIDMVWNVFMGRNRVKANDVILPRLSEKAYVQYGVGLQKTWADRFTGFLQAMVRNGGRNGIVLSAGFRWAIGKTPQNNNKHPQETSKKVIKKL